MILCETFWKPSLADFAKQHKQTIYSIFLQVLFLCLALCFQPPSLSPFWVSFTLFTGLCFLILVRSLALWALHHPSTHSYNQALGYDFGQGGGGEVARHRGHGFSTERKKGKGGGRRMITFCSCFCPWCWENRVESIPSIITLHWHSTHRRRDHDNVAEDKRIDSSVPRLVFCNPCMEAVGLPP